MKWFLAGAALVAIGTLIYFSIMFTGPRMQVQPKIKTYSRSMPLPPGGVVPVEKNDRALPSAAQASRMKNPVADNQQNRDRGKVYYGYYCLFCHGENGQGDGPVGYSYMPAPTDLHDPKLARKSDGDLMRSMLLGTGHEPVLSRIVLPVHRWYLVTYVRALGKAPRKPSENYGSQVLTRGRGNK